MGRLAALGNRFPWVSVRFPVDFGARCPPTTAEEPGNRHDTISDRL
jgi:hypothetical protein